MDLSSDSVSAQPATNLSSRENAIQGGQALHPADEDLFTIEEIIDREMDDLSQLDEKYCEDSFYYGWFIDEIFGYDSTCTKQQFSLVLENKRFAWLFDTIDIRNKVLKKLQEEED